MEWFIWSFLAIAVLLVFVVNLIATRLCIVDDSSGGLQVIGQLAVVWLIPAIGGLCAIYLVAQHYRADELKSLLPWPIYGFIVSSEQRDSAVERMTESTDDYIGEGACGADG